MKYVIRRLIAGVVLTPIVAVAYTALYTLLVFAGGVPTSSIQEVFTLGLEIGLAMAIVLQFPKITNNLF